MNSLIPVSNTLPAYLQQMQYRPSGLGSGISDRSPRLGITITREFTLTKNGQTMVLPTRTVRVVLVAAADGLNKAWFAKPYQPGSDAPPDCYSNDGVSPHPAAQSKQAAVCAVCPKNAFGSNPVTGRGKACSDRKRVVLVLESDPNELVRMNWPTTSLPALKNLDAQLEQAKIPMQALLLELSFSSTVQYSQLNINPVGFVPEELCRSLVEKAGTSVVQDMLGQSEWEDLGEAPAAPAQPAYGAPAAPEPPSQQAQTPLQGFSQPAPTQAAPAPTQAAPAPTQAAAAPQKRKRRTKAEMEAARAAEAVAAAQQAQTAPVTPPQQAPAPLPGFGQPAPTQAAPAPTQAAPAPTQNQAAAVLDLINKWKAS